MKLLHLLLLPCVLVAAGPTEPDRDRLTLPPEYETDRYPIPAPESYSPLGLDVEHTYVSYSVLVKPDSTVEHGMTTTWHQEEVGDTTLPSGEKWRKNVLWLTSYLSLDSTPYVRSSTFPDTFYMRQINLAVYRSSRLGMKPRKLPELPLMEGTQWTRFESENLKTVSTAIRQEEVTTPVGTFPGAWRVETEASAPYSFVEWYVLGIGVVKAESEFRGEEKGNTIQVTESVSYRIK